MFGLVILLEKGALKCLSPLKVCLVADDVFMCLSNTSSVIQKIVFVFQLLVLLVVLNLLVQHYVEGTGRDQLRYLVLYDFFVPLLRVYLLFEIVLFIAVAQFKITLNLTINYLKFLRIY